MNRAIIVMMKLTLLVNFYTI